MPVKPFVGQEEPPLDAPIWRYMDLEKFHDLLASEELYFRRMDKFKKDDPHEGLPPDDFVRKIRGLRRYDLRDEQTLNNAQAVNRQFSEGHYIQCWNLREGEKLEMWRRYAPCGVAVASRYELLRATLDAQIDEFHLGLVHYGKNTRLRDNILENAFHKDYRFENESEVRALLWVPNMFAGNNRHFDEDNFPHREPLDDVYPLPKWVPDFKRRRVKLKELVLEVTVSPWANDAAWQDVEVWTRNRGFSLRRSELAGPFAPTLKEWDALHPRPKSEPAKACK
jgi:hypothetical protein